MLTKRIFNKPTAFELINRGHDLVRTEQSHKKKWMKVFVFQQTDKLLEDLTEISLLKNKDKAL